MFSVNELNFFQFYLHILQGESGTGRKHSILVTQNPISKPEKPTETRIIRKCHLRDTIVRNRAHLRCIFEKNSRSLIQQTLIFNAFRTGVLTSHTFGTLSSSGFYWFSRELLSTKFSASLVWIKFRPKFNLPF